MPAATCGSAERRRCRGSSTSRAPFPNEILFEFELAEGAVATSGLATRIWHSEQGYAHHLIDPSTGRPAWTGVIQATALGPTALAAETLAKMALLSGPEGARSLLGESGGALVLDDGSVERVGALRTNLDAVTVG